MLHEPGLETPTQILLDGERTAKELARQRRVEALQGSKVYAYSFFWQVFVNREKVVDANLRADHGIARAIDGVLLPKAR